MSIKKDALAYGVKRIISVFLCTVMICVAFAGCRKGPSDTVSQRSASEQRDNTDSSENLPSTEDGGTDDSASYPVAEESDGGNDAPTPWVNPAPERQRDRIVVSKVVNSGDKYYIEYLGKPYLNYGVQLTRREQIVNEKMWEEFFQKSAEIEFKNVLVKVNWDAIEPEKDKYNMFVVKQLIDFAEKYGLRLEILWFGSDVCGSPDKAPSYIKDDEQTYPRYGETKFYDFSNPKLLEREKKALCKMLDYIYDYDKNRRVSMIQVLNEPNFSNGYQQEALYEYTNQLGLTVKNSPYSVVTRMNLVIYDSYLEPTNLIPENLVALPGIDMVGPDIYTTDLNYYRRFFNRFSLGTMPTNVMYIPEGPGQMENYPKQVLLAFMHNSGYDVYELKSYGNVDFDFGIFRSDSANWIYRDGTKKAQHQWERGKFVPESKTTDIITLNRMINRVSEQIASCPTDQFKMIFRRYSDTIGEQKITFVTEEDRIANRVGAIFLAADGYYYFFTPAQEGYFDFNGKTVNGEASVGGFVNGQWNQTGTAPVSNGNRVDVKVGNVYRIAATQIN